VNLVESSHYTTFFFSVQNLKIIIFFAPSQILSYFFFLSFFHPEIGRAAWGRPPPLLFPLSILGESNNTYNAVVQYEVAAARSLLIMRFYYLLIS